MRLGIYLGIFIGLKNTGWIGGDMAAFKLQESTESGIKGARVPDLFYISYSRLPPNSDFHIIPSFAPDLAVEVISESESHTKILKKTADFLDHGTRLVWHVIGTLRQVHVFTPDNRAGTILTDPDTLTGGDVLPGFAVPVRAIFDVTDADLHAATLRDLLAR